MPFDFNDLPECRQRMAMEFFRQIVADTFERPGEEERFQAWLTEYRAKQAAKAASK